MSVDVPNEKILFVTGRLAAPGLREVVHALAEQVGFDFDVLVPGVQVAALMHVRLLEKRLEVPSDIDRIVLPGWVQGDISALQQKFGCVVERGPKDYRDLPEYFGLGRRPPVDLSDYSIQILGEINHATRMKTSDVVAAANAMAQDGADLIDVGCVPGESSDRVFELVTALREAGLAVSIDSFDQHEVEQAVRGGAELILSCNHSNIDWVTSFGVEVVAIPDSPADVQSLDRIIGRLLDCGCPFRIDPILEPIAMGFTESLQRYIDVRHRYPDLTVMMGVGNVTELTEVDSAGVNMLLAAICEELQITSILTTQVINWCRTAVAEFDAARRLAHYAVKNRVLPKHLDSSLVMLRDPRLKSDSTVVLEQLAQSLTDSNFRIFANDDGLHLMNRHGHWSGDNVFQIFDQALQQQPKTADNSEPVDAGHAFYLGYEMARAEISRMLGRQYEQDAPQTWGLAGRLPGSASIHHGMVDASADETTGTDQNSAKEDNAANDRDVVDETNRREAES
ncbi:MAG: dihydropteroate synthase [Fuerstiella sp.]